MRTTRPDPWGQRVVFLKSGVPVRRVPVSLSRRFHQICTAVAAEVAGKKDLNTIQFGALTYLYEEADLDQRALAARLGIDQSSTSALLDVLEEKRLVKRRKDPNDRRAWRLDITPAGRKVRDELRPYAGVGQQRVLAPLAPRDRERFLDMLVKIIEANESYARPGPDRRKPGRKQK